MEQKLSKYCTCVDQRVCTILYSTVRRKTFAWAATFLQKETHSPHRAWIISPLPLRVAKTGKKHLDEEFTPLLPIGIGDRF
jgi:hypothetical protein